MTLENIILAAWWLLVGVVTSRMLSQPHKAVRIALERFFHENDGYQTALDMRGFLVKQGLSCGLLKLYGILHEMEGENLIVSKMEDGPYPRRKLFRKKHGLD